MTGEEFEHKVKHIHENKETDNPEKFRVLGVTSLNHTIDIRTSFEDENFVHLIDVYEKIMQKVMEIEKNG